jgi:glycosyltransferase involved in cell wall biosynthesis
MGAGRPVVVTGVGGNPEIVRDGVDGLLVPRGDHAAAAGALLRLLGDGQLARAMGQSGAARIRDHYQLDQTMDRYYALYAAEAARTDQPEEVR